MDERYQSMRLLCLSLQQLMSNINTATYVKKLIKVIYEKENQIETLKKELRNNGSTVGMSKNEEQQDHSGPLDQNIKNELFLTAGQLREVNLKMNQMENKMVELELGLQEEIVKNNELEKEIARLKKQNAFLEEERTNSEKEMKAENDGLRQALEKYKEEVEEIEEEIEQLKESESVLRSEKNQLIIEINEIRECEERYIKHQSKKNEGKEQEQKLLQQGNIDAPLLRIAELQHELISLTLSYNKQAQEMKIKEELLQAKQREADHLSETLKNYEEFAFEIAKYIELAFAKHCAENLYNSKKQPAESIFEASYKKMAQIQAWMDLASQKLEKLTQQTQIPNHTLENISVILKSFEDRTEMPEFPPKVEPQQLMRNQQQLISNLQKQCERSYYLQRSKLVQLGEMKEVLKMTKEVNRELMDQINQKQYVISECRRIYKKVAKNRNSQDLNQLQRLLDRN